MLLSQLFRNNKFRYAFYILVAQGIFMFCNLYINHWISENWHIESFAIFNLIKRISSFIIYPLLVGVGIGIPKYISFLKTNVKDNGFEYLLGGFFIFLITFLIFASFIFAFPSIILHAFKNIGFKQSKIVFSILIFVFSQGLYVLLNSYYRGNIKFAKMSILNVVIMSALPLVTLFIVDDVFSYYLDYSAFTLLIIVSIFVYFGLNTTISIKRIRYKTIRLFNFGYPRIIAEIGLFAIEFIPVFLVSIYIGLIPSGYISMIFILLKIAGMLYELVGSLILPYFGKLFKTQTMTVFISKVNLLLIYGGVSAFAITLIFYFFIPVLIRQFFPALTEAIYPAQLVFVAFPIYSLYLLLRNVLDVVANKAYNSINLGITCIIQVIILVFGLYLRNFIIYSVMSVVIPYFAVGLLSYITWIKIKKDLNKTNVHLI